MNDIITVNLRKCNIGYVKVNTRKIRILSYYPCSSQTPSHFHGKEELQPGHL